MNRCEFLGQTHNGPITSDDIISFFDHNMAAYDILKDIKESNITTIQDLVHSSLKIQVESSNIPELESVVDYVNNEIHNRKNMYDRNFKLEANVEGNVCTLSIREEF